MIISSRERTPHYNIGVLMQFKESFLGATNFYWTGWSFMFDVIEKRVYSPTILKMQKIFAAEIPEDQSF
jgi:hypothetical protein